ncbi:type VI secretion system tube protein Hcp [Photorhabdus bodei]|uniref:Type VI secretion system tube protein Hcp n=1 Tax=Photorhabdus bodei TaxID=2029681 RepID=A0A329X8X9_9GAMM|nr:type VI secretion system tube protein Hcp [Photorhabdus bodei]NDL03934.1 type VI secretion system tube protein Hcp [Photorhabdus bodei]NDL07985.1 type VI secretion system tube protein Hcp [Photorhabdus bodei]RAX13307.1 type VI secretion system tube protein Hcp [Photorhabdus bodei]
MSRCIAAARERIPGSIDNYVTGVRECSQQRGNLKDNGYNLNHSLTWDQHAKHHPITFKKPVDKSSPLLGIAMSENEVLDGIFDIYRTNRFGIQELYYTIKVIEATIVDLAVYHPHSITHAGAQPQETISLRYKSITWTHHIAGTSAYSIWDDRVY